MTFAIYKDGKQYSNPRAHYAMVLLLARRMGLVVKDEVLCDGYEIKEVD